MFTYYFVCKRKLWYFSHDIQMEKDNDDVAIGKLIDETTYKRESKQVLIDNMINIDFVDKDIKVHEIKKSKSIEEASIWQVKYYLWYLKQKGMQDITGELNYPKLKRTEKVTLSKEDEEQIIDYIKKIEKVITKQEIPKVTNQPICDKCAYYELCYV